MSRKWIVRGWAIIALLAFVISSFAVDRGGAFGFGLAVINGAIFGFALFQLTNIASDR